MAIKLSNLIKRQLPEFISTHYSAFSTFLEKYYEGLEITGQPLDILSNLTEYYDINFYEKQILKEGSYLVGNVSISDTILEVEEGSSFPQENGYFKINDEICFYAYRVGNQFFDVVRGVSGNTKLGDLYNKTTFISTTSQNHSSGDYVQNISNLFLFAIVKSFEKQYLESIPEKYLKKEIDKKTLIKNITDFYKSKGSEKSIKFIFKTLVSDSPTENVYIKRPTDQTIKASVSDWISDYVVKIDIVSGNPQNLVGEKVIQESPYASFVVDRVEQNSEGGVDLVIDPSSVISEFEIFGYTKLVNPISSIDNEDFVIDVVSTRSWSLANSKLYIGSETFEISDRNINQFTIKSRTGNSSYSSGTYIYSKSPYTVNGVKFIITGTSYNLVAKSKKPYALPADNIVNASSAKDSNDRVVFDIFQNSYRWVKNNNRQRPSVLTNLNLQSQLSDVNANVSAILEDENYFYICSSGYPSFDILSAQFTGNLKDNKYLKLIKKYPSVSTDSYETGTDDVGILVDGSLIYGKKSTSYVKYGPITKVNILNKGSGYLQPPVVLVNNSPAKARAILSGEVVSDIEVITTQDYKKTPNVIITSGRGAIIDAKVTSGKITNLVIVNPGEYYVSPPKIVITDKLGRGNFAEYKSVISKKGTIIGFEKINEGRNYSSGNVVIQVIPQGNGAEAEFEIKKWYKNRYTELNQFDQNGGTLVQKKFENYSTYCVVSNPRKLRYAIGDNITSTLQESITSHSKIIGYAYDGNPIYGPYGYSNPLDSQSSVARMRSGYTLNSNRNNGPSVSLYPLGTFDEDYTWSPNVNTGKLYLDENNGRFCVTPEYPEGTYAYFVTINTSGISEYPYILGKNYYSIPVDSNYNKPITQNDIPRAAKFLNFSEYLDNGRSFSAVVSEVESGNINGFVIDQVFTEHNPGNKIFVDNSGTSGEGFAGSVETVTGKSVSYLRSKDSVCILQTDSPVYLFKNYLLKQQNTGFTGSIVGDVRFDNQIVLESVNTKFNESQLFDLVNPSNNQVVKILNIVLDQNSSYTSGASIKLTDGKTKADSVKATGIILETTANQNTVRVLVNTGNFNLGIDSEILFLQSSDLANTIGTKIVTTNSLSENISVFNFNYNYAIVKTNANHNLVVNDTINVSVNPDDLETEKTFYVRKKLFQTLILQDQQLEAKLIDTGIGKASILTGGLYSTNGTFNANLGNAQVSVTITNYLDFKNPQLSVLLPGTGYEVGNRIETSGGNGDGLVINIDSVGPNGQILTVSVSDYGSGYSNNDNVSPVQEGNGAVIKINYNSYNSISNLQVVNKGSGFKEGSVLTLSGLTGVTQTKPALFRVDHVGFSSTDTVIKSSSVENIAINDYLTIEDEIVKVTAIDYTQRKITVLRGQKGSEAVNHFNGAKIAFDDFVYKFTTGQYIPELGTDSLSPKIYSYDSNTNTLVLSYEYGATPETTTNISLSSFIKDESGPNRKSVRISIVEPKVFKLEFSEDTESNFKVNPILDLQLYYKYVFNTGHSSMLNTYLDFSPSINYNIITEEKIVGSYEPGTNSNAFISLKFGFGPNISTNDYSVKKDLRFSNFYYFVVASGVETNESKLQIISDPLTGPKSIKYSTDDKFVYSVDRFPQENGTGNISYVTNSSNASGQINSFKIDNSGFNYIDVPSIIGIETPSFRAASVSPNFDSFGGIESFDILDSGYGYINPKIIVTGNGTSGQYIPIVQGGKISNISVIKKGNGFTKLPSIEIVEGCNKVYLSSNNIGYPKTITVKNSGNFYSTDTSTIPEYKTFFAVILKNVNESEFTGESTVRQFNESGDVIFIGKVNKSGIRPGSNIVRIQPISGSITKERPLGTAEIIAVLYTEYDVELKSYYDKLGFYNSEKGLVSSADSKITDSYYYQDYSYVIGSNTPIDLWRDLIKDVVHPAGFKLFGEVQVEGAKGDLLQPSQQAQSPLIRILNAGVQGAFTHVSKTLLTERIEVVKNQNIKRGKGRVAVDDQNLTTTYAKDVRLIPEFDGYVDPDTNQIFGTKTFDIIDVKTGQMVSPYNEASIVVSLSGVIQEPKISYTVSGSQITFTTAPLGSRVSEGQNLDADEFIGKVVGYKSTADNQKSFKKLRNIFQRNGIWLDAANQIRSNKNFIIEESYGYLKAKYPSLSFDTGKCKRDIGYIIDAFEHDLRFGGNTKTVTAGEFYYNVANQLNFINNELEETKEAYFYAASLCAAAIRNWDVAFIDDPSTTTQYEVNIFADSDIINVPSTFGIVEGMYLSSGSQFPLNTRVLEVIDNNTLRVDTNAFSNISDTAAIVLTVPAADVVQLTPGEYEYNGVILEGTLTVQDSTTVTIVARIAKLRQVRFSLSRVNTGTFIDAANLIAANRKYIVNQTISYIATTFPGFKNPSEKKCRRDIGYLIDAIVYHLTYGGNNRLVDYAEKYYLANKLNYINNELSETIVGFEYATALMLDAIQDPGAPFNTVGYNVALDLANPLNECSEVVSAINSYKETYTFILENGPNLIQRDFGNVQRSGKYTDLLTYSNYNLLDDQDLLNATQINGVWYASECADVVSSLYTLQQSLNTILTDGLDSVEKTTPDYFDGENRIFDLYTDDNQLVKTEEKEDLLIYINGVLQRPTAYTVIRSEDINQTDKIEFSEAPRWDQNEAQIRLNQGTAVDYFHGVSIGAYERKTVDLKYGNLDNAYTLIKLNGDLSNTILDSRYCIVFVDGVLQENESDYEIKANRIYFKKKLNYFKPESGEVIKSEVDVIQFFGEVNYDTITAFDFQNNTYVSKATIDIYYETQNSDFGKEIIEWNRSSATYAPHLYNGTNYIGTVTNIQEISTPYPGARFDLLVEHNPQLNSALPLIFKKYRLNVPDYVLDISFVVNQNTTLNQPGNTLVYGSITVNNPYTLTIQETTTVISAGAVFNYQQDSNEDRVLQRAVSPYLVDKAYWKNRDWRVSNKLNASILEGDKIKIDGEKKFRDILKVPDLVKTTEFNPFKSSTNKIYGDLVVSPSVEKPSGTGLAVNAILGSNGKVVGLDWNKPDPVKFTALGIPIPDIANGYEGDVFVDFIPSDGNGGGAFAAANIVNGTVIGFTLISGGSGYTKPPIAVITRGFDIIKSQREIVPYIERDYVIKIPRPINIYSQQVTLIRPNVSDYFIYINTASSFTRKEQTLTLFTESNLVGKNVKFSVTAIPQALLKTIPVIGTVAPSVQIPEVLFTKPYQSLQAVGASQLTQGQVTYFSESFVGAGDTLITPENIASLVALVNVNFNIGDTTLYVTSTAGFPNSGLLFVGTEVVEYGSKQSDRFIITSRAARSSTQQNHPVGTQVTVYLDFLNANRAPINVVESDGFANSPFFTYTEIVLLSKEKVDSIPSTIAIVGETDNRRFGKFIEQKLFTNVSATSSTTKTFFSETVNGIGATFAPTTFSLLLDSQAVGQNQVVTYREVDFKEIVEKSVNVGSISSYSFITPLITSTTNTSFNISAITISDIDFFVEKPSTVVSESVLDVKLVTASIKETVTTVDQKITLTSIQSVKYELTTLNNSIILGNNLQISLKESDSRVLFEAQTPIESLSVVLLTNDISRQLTESVNTIGFVSQLTTYDTYISPIVQSTPIVITQTNAQAFSQLVSISESVPKLTSVSVSLVSANINNVTDETTVTLGYVSTPFYVGVSNVIKQELRKQPEDVVSDTQSELFAIKSSVEVTSSTQPVKNTNTPTSSTTSIDSGVQNGTIDAFNENINAATIETNNP